MIPDAWIPGAWFIANSVLLRMARWAWRIYELPLLIAWVGASLIVGSMTSRLHRGQRAAALSHVFCLNSRRQLSGRCLSDVTLTSHS
jgi:hypothetical protein